MSKLTHLDDAGAAHMVDVSAKAVTKREATAAGHIAMSPEALSAIREGALKKGDALGVARVAGIMAAKRTSELVPLCHPLSLTGIEVRIEIDDSLPGFRICAEVRTKAETGVEMEALTAVAVAGLTLFDMLKAIDRTMAIGGIEVTSKTK